MSDCRCDDCMIRKGTPNLYGIRVPSPSGFRSWGTGPAWATLAWTRRKSALAYLRRSAPNWHALGATVEPLPASEAQHATIRSKR